MAKNNQVPLKMIGRTDPSTYQPDEAGYYGKGGRGEGKKMPTFPTIVMNEGTEDLGNELISKGLMSFDQVNKSAMNFAQGAMEHANQWLDSVSGFGMAKALNAKAQRQMQSSTSVMVDGAMDEDDLPLGPGFSYMTHLFNYNNSSKKFNDEAKKAMTKGANIFTDASEALKLAIKIMGVMNDKNPGGLPIEIDDAQKIWFGDKDVDDIQRTQWRTTIEMANPDYDPKKVRKFTNYDGSMTWEILNNDKTVMNRFTLGEHNGTKVFAQGGYKKFADLLNKIKDKMPNSAEGFDQMTSMIGGY